MSVGNKNSFVELYLGSKVCVRYFEEGKEKSIVGIVKDFDNINFIRVVGDFREKIISTVNIISVKRYGGLND